MRSPFLPVFAAALVTSLVTSLAAQAPAVAYDPLRKGEMQLPASLDLDVVDAERDRTVPVRVQLPANAGAAPVVLFSHGLGGTRTTCKYLAEHWAARGYAVVFLQHPGSDDSVWRGAKLGERMAAMREAASGKNLMLRAGDVRIVLDRLTEWNAAEGHALHGRLDLEHVGMSGHSFGAMTTQVTTGQSLPLVGRRLTDARIDAAIAMSPAAKERQQKSFAEVAVPWFAMTGTDDVSPINDTTVEDRLRVYPSLPSTIDRYQLVLDGAEHSAFTEGRLPGERNPHRDNHHRSILALSTAFWDAHLRGSAEARAWLQGDGPGAVLDPKDRFEQAHRAPSTTK